MARDVGELTSGLGVEEFAVLGVSGGGPFALAAGAALTPRVGRVLVAAGPGPCHEIAPEDLEPEDTEALELLAAGEVDAAVALVTAGVRRDFDAMRRLPASEFVRDNLSWIGPWDFDLADVATSVLLSYGDADSMVAHGEVSFGLSEWFFATLQQ